jgi:ubiquinone/menaquinone biosynthesis C-methylase UbiE
MGYYSEKLAGQRLKRCYDIASPRVKRYLRAEIDHVLSGVSDKDTVLELGCGYGRVTCEMAAAAKRAVGIDTAMESLQLAVALMSKKDACDFLMMDAVRMAFPDNIFDVTACVQNGICAFGVDPQALLREAVRVTRPGGRVLFSSYSRKFWDHRLRWFERQSEEGLLGAIDYRRTGDGVIVCRDGFRAGLMGEEELRSLCGKIGLQPLVTEVDMSSIFFELTKPYGEDRKI